MDEDESLEIPSIHFHVCVRAYVLERERRSRRIIRVLRTHHLLGVKMAGRASVRARAYTPHLQHFYFGVKAVAIVRAAAAASITPSPAAAAAAAAILGDQAADRRRSDRSYILER